MNGTNDKEPAQSAAAGPGVPRYVGLDVHRRQVTWCIIDAAGKTVGTGELALSAATLAWFATSVLRPADQVVLESTTNCHAVAAALRPHAARVVVSNPMATKAIATSKIKTDKVDAQVLAQLLRCDFIPEVWQPDEETSLRRQLSGRRASLVQQRVQLQNRIHSVLAMRLIVPPGDVALFSKAGRTWLEKLDTSSIDADGLAMIASDLRMIDSIEKEIDVFERRLADLAWEDRRVRLLMTMPGVSIVVAQALVAAFGDITRFPTADKAAAYLGLVPSTRQSASTTHHGPITKRGNSNARWMLVQAAQHMARQPGPLGHFFRRLKKRKNHNVAVVATARKMAMVAWHMLRRGEPYRYAVPRSTETKLARLRIQATGQRRKGGLGPGVKAKARLEGGSRTIKPLDVIYHREGLPLRQTLAAGELKAVSQNGCEAFLRQIGQEQVIPRRETRSRNEPAPETNPNPRNGSGQQASPHANPK